MIFLPLTYLGPLQAYCRYFQQEKILIEQCGTYQKQTYSNRCEIYGANGRLGLSIPVQHESGKRLKVKETRIDYATDWRRLHWKGIVSAYNSSPYFEFYQDIFEPYYRKEFVFLIDLCIRLNEEVLGILHVSGEAGLTDEFCPSPALPGGEGVGNLNAEIVDLRGVIHPKINFERDGGFKTVEYTQVFSEKHGFIQNLSILDLIFNMGPESEELLRSCLK